MKTSLKKFKIAVTLAAIFLYTKADAQFQPEMADSFYHFLQANKGRASLYISRNDTVSIGFNENKLMPLASTVKILVAVEFAKQAANAIFNEEDNVALSELEKYYIPNTDGDAHPQWLEYEKGRGTIRNDSISLIDVARGMIMFSSNANTEFLIDLLGEDNVKNNIQLFGLKQHTPVFHLVSSLFMYQNPFKLKETDVLKGIRKLTEEEYCKVAYGIHYHLKNDSAFKQKFRPQDLSMKMQKLWSDRLPASTTREYVQIAKVLNNRKLFDENTYGVIAQVLEYPMENKAFQQAFKHYGVKGGSTSFVLTHVIYFTSKSNVRMEMAVFFNELTEKENNDLQRWLDPFEAQVIFDRKFRESLKF